MVRTDRTLIAPLLLEYYPLMEKATSNEWHGLLNAETGLNIELDEPNPVAFDKWRQALAQIKGWPVWGYSDAYIAEIKRRGEELKAAEDLRISKLENTLEVASLMAPTKSWQQLIKDAKQAFA